MNSTSILERRAAADALDPIIFRNTLGHFGSGVTVVTGHDGTEPIGFTCQAFTSVSLDPPLVSISVMTTSTTYPRIRETGKFAVNVLAHDQHGLSNQFARKGTDKWAGVEWTAAPSGNPLLEGALIWVDCEFYAEHLAGDHLIVLGRVLGISEIPVDESEPLLFYKGQYRRLGPAHEA